MTSPNAHGSNAKRQAAYRQRLRQAQQSLLSCKGLPPLPAVSNIAGWSRWKMAMRQVAQLLEQVKFEMEAYYEERSDLWLESEAAETFQERLDQLHEFIDQAPDWS